MADEIGYQSSSLPGWGDISGEANETNSDLIWPRSVEVFDKMRKEDSQVGSVLRAVTSPIQQATWSIDPAGAREEVVELVADSLGLPIKGQEHDEPLRTRDRFSWDSHLQHVLLMLPHGHSYFEQVYRIEGERAYLKKLAWRPRRVSRPVPSRPSSAVRASSPPRSRTAASRRRRWTGGRTCSPRTRTGP